MCILVAILFCFSATAAVNPSLTPEQKKLARDAREVLGTYCGNCHGKAGSFNDEMLIDHALLKQEKFFIPGKPNESPLYTIIFDEKKHASKKGDKKMPPHEDRGKSNGKVPQNKLDIIKEWIDAGAPPWDIKPVPPDPPITHLQMLKWMAEDLKKLGPADRKDTRYFTLTHLHNAGELSYDMDDYRTALSKLVNSLSWEPEIINPQAIEHGNETILRISLADYQWDREIWEKISRDEPQPYPYNINFAGNQDRDYLIRETGAAFPFVRADWFIANAAKPELYHEILKLPDTDLKLENDKLHMTKNEVANNIGDGVSRRFMRSGFLVWSAIKREEAPTGNPMTSVPTWVRRTYSGSPWGPRSSSRMELISARRSFSKKVFNRTEVKLFSPCPTDCMATFWWMTRAGALIGRPLILCGTSIPGPATTPRSATVFHA